MSNVIRILVANRPKLMREALLGTLADQPWIEVVGEVADEADIPDSVSKTLPDLLVIAVDGPGSGRFCATGCCRSIPTYGLSLSLPTRTTEWHTGLLWTSIPPTSSLPRRDSWVRYATWRKALAYSSNPKRRPTQQL